MTSCSEWWNNMNNGQRWVFLLILFVLIIALSWQSCQNGWYKCSGNAMGGENYYSGRGYY